MGTRVIQVRGQQKICVDRDERERQDRLQARPHTINTYIMFSTIKMAIAIMLITGIAGAGVYVMKLRADNATLKANQIELEKGIEAQTKLIEQQKVDFEAIMESNKKLNVLVQTFKKDLDELDKRFNKKKRDVGKLAIERSKSVERVM